VDYRHGVLYLVTGATDDGGEDSARRVITGEPSLHQAGAVVTHQGSSLFFLTHDVSSETHTAVRVHTHRVALLDPVIKSPVCLGYVSRFLFLFQAQRTQNMPTKKRTNCF